MVQEIHTTIKGRARYRVNRLYRSEFLKRILESNLSQFKGIQHTSASTLTGNVLVLFNSDNTHSKIAALIVEIVRSYEKNGSQRHQPSPNDGTLIPFEGDKENRWHLSNADSVLSTLNSSRINGLSSHTAEQRLEKFGPNILPGTIPRSGFNIFLNQFKSLPVALLGVAAGLSLLTSGFVDAVVILGVIVINATIGYVTERGAEKTIESLKSLVRPAAFVIRDSCVKEIKAAEIVVGDLLVLKPGSYILADARLVETTCLYVDESALTGESIPVLKTADPILGREVPLADRVNMIYMGTLVTGGSGFAVVVATGRLTEMGWVQTLIGEAESPETPMEKELRQIGNQLVFICGGVCGVVFLIGLLRGYGFIQMLRISISLAIAAVPEGLPTVATTTLAIGIRNMRRQNVMIRRLNAVETLGSVQTICLDKTGTITLNRMTVVSIYTGMKNIRVLDGKFISGEEDINPFSCDELLKLIHVSVLCSETEVTNQEGEYILRGSPTENALLYVAISSGIDILRLRERYPLFRMNHRSENRNYMSTLHRSGKEEADRPSLLLAVKGSPSEVLARSRWHIKEGEMVPLTTEDRLNIEIENERMSGKALRILGTAYTYIDEETSDQDTHKNLIWLGLIGMSDPIRKGVKELVGVFHQAGIETVMITGDQSPTAYAIGKELKLSGKEELEILDSTHLADIDPDVMTALSEKIHVFARVSPAHKLRIVQSLQKAGKVVAMTGDGINDGPALKAADIGIAMGHSGTDVAREVADVVLENDNLETMIVAVSHGRTIYNNIRKSIHFLLATNLSEIMVTLAAISAGIGQPINHMQLLWINLISDIFPGLALALEAPEPDVLKQPPRKVGESPIKGSDFKRITFEAATLSAGALGAYGYGMMRYGVGPRAGTLAFMSLTSAQLVHAISCRSETRKSLPPNPYLWTALTGSFALQGLAMVVPGLRNVLGIAPITLLDGVVIGSSALLPFLANESTKGKIP